MRRPRQSKYRVLTGEEMKKWLPANGIVSKKVDGDRQIRRFGGGSAQAVRKEAEADMLRHQNGGGSSEAWDGRRQAPSRYVLKAHLPPSRFLLRLTDEGFSPGPVFAAHSTRRASVCT